MKIDLLNQELFQKSISTLKETSYDATNDEYMTECSKNALDFDNIKRTYTNALGFSEEYMKSVDALLYFSKEITFVEFKNGNMKNAKKEIKEKTLDSLLLFCDVTKKGLSFTRNNLDFILVYNEEKNSGGLSHSKSRDKISEYCLEKSGEELIHFGLEKLKGVHFREVHTYTKEEFSGFFTWC